MQWPYCGCYDNQEPAARGATQGIAQDRYGIVSVFKDIEDGDRFESALLPFSREFIVRQGEVERNVHPVSGSKVDSLHPFHPEFSRQLAQVRCFALDFRGPDLQERGFHESPFAAQSEILDINSGHIRGGILGNPALPPK